VYSTDEPDDLKRLMTTAKGAGLDALVMSWSGKDFSGPDHRRMLRCLAAAHAVGFKVAALFETTVANARHRDGDADADTVLSWLTDVVDEYASQPGYLRVDGRPVVMAYAAQRLPQAGWVDALRRLRATGRDVLLIGEGSNNTRLGAFDGQFYYASNDFPGDTIEAFDRAQSLNVRTYHLLPTDTVGRRVWVATVSPGYDDTHLHDGRVARLTDRADGAYYKTQWRAAIDNRADWVVVTSWNEYLENTEIEKTRIHGDLYLRLTEWWSALFRRLHPVAVPRPHP
jgi:glycoprotein endo-alpha-1,2-mannosidase